MVLIPQRHFLLCFDLTELISKLPLYDAEEFRQVCWRRRRHFRTFPVSALSFPFFLVLPISIFLHIHQRKAFLCSQTPPAGRFQSRILFEDLRHGTSGSLELVHFL
ncbi:hypothetical protein Vretimale_2335 [Volvox reticuliferus]|uniref:Uncharacterized protein n=1 Tax=Volvox reticuliferus TaxID=1737510 RepID=A0A8J4FH17_9CHLO|nr:hypothetical protein Vretifemale_4599 [Volvox reticuliferus]GIL96546.1 hypothetical protein Vretimale_2335 [Volvox reticuliferus]